MFALRGLAVSLSVFAIVYSALSLVVCLSWRRLRDQVQNPPPLRIANFLFALRMLPLVAAVTVTAALAVPSFVLLEPRAVDEPMGLLPILLGCGGMAVVLIGSLNTARTMRKVSQTVSTWTNQAQSIQNGPVPVLRIPSPIPPMTAVGIFRPRILISSAAEFVLFDRERRAALNHEMVHVRRRDNLRKVLLQFVAFPGMAGLETAWLEATEMAADDAAVTNASEALDLAAALIKVSRLPAEPVADLTTALVRSPASIMNARVERLLAWKDHRASTRPAVSAWYGGAAALAAFATFALTYSHLLVRVHTATEWLVR